MATKRANYFYCVRIADTTIGKNITDALEWIVDKEPQYDEYCYTREMLHVTLCEVSLQNEEEIKQASQVLQDWRQQLQAKTPTTPLVFRGISNFHEKVMYAKVEHGEDLRTFAEFLKLKAKEAGVQVVENHDFNPHMTILKVSSVKARKAKVPNINPWLYVNLKETLFGEQQVRSVHLCKMGRDRRSDGFYQTPSEIIL